MLAKRVRCLEEVIVNVFWIVPNPPRYEQYVSTTSKSNLAVQVQGLIFYLSLIIVYVHTIYILQN
jgi:hypothetical protein